MGVPGYSVTYRGYPLEATPRITKTGHPMKVIFALIALGVIIEAGQCLVMSFQDITKFKDYKR